MLVVGLAFLTLAAYFVLLRTTRNWFETDLALRARFAADAARAGLIYAIHSGDPEVVQERLIDLTRNERIMAAAVCGPEWQPLAITDIFPAEFACSTIGRQVEATEAREGKVGS